MKATEKPHGLHHLCVNQALETEDRIISLYFTTNPADIT